MKKFPMTETAVRITNALLYNQRDSQRTYEVSTDPSSPTVIASLLIDEVPNSPQVCGTTLKQIEQLDRYDVCDHANNSISLDVSLSTVNYAPEIESQIEYKPKPRLFHPPLPLAVDALPFPPDIREGSGYGPINIHDISIHSEIISDVIKCAHNEPIVTNTMRRTSNIPHRSVLSRTSRQSFYECHWEWITRKPDTLHIKGARIRFFKMLDGPKIDNQQEYGIEITRKHEDCVNGTSVVERVEETVNLVLTIKSSCGGTLNNSHRVFQNILRFIEGRMCDYINEGNDDYGLIVSQTVHKFRTIYISSGEGYVDAVPTTVNEYNKFVEDHTSSAFTNTLVMVDEHIWVKNHNESQYTPRFPRIELEISNCFVKRLSTLLSFTTAVEKVGASNEETASIALGNVMDVLARMDPKHILALYYTPRTLNYLNRLK